jgi:hypothetical protein
MRLTGTAITTTSRQLVSVPVGTVVATTKKGLGRQFQSDAGVSNIHSATRLTISALVIAHAVSP